MIAITAGKAAATISAPPANRKPQFAKPHISISQVKAYSSCSLQWKFSRAYKPECVSSSLVFGSAFHAAIEALHQARLEGGDIFSDWLESEALPIHFCKGEDKQSMRETAGRMIDAYLAQLKPSHVIAIEEPFELQLADDMPLIVGSIDMIELRKDDDGVERSYMVDLKTAARKPDPDDMDVDQLVLYHLAAEKLGLAKQLGLPLALRYDIVTKTKNPEVFSIPVNPTSIDRARVIEKIKTCWRGMNAGICFPSRGWQCAGCGYAKRCASWPNE